MSTTTQSTNIKVFIVFSSKIYKQNDMTPQVTGRQGNSAMRRQNDTKPNESENVTLKHTNICIILYIFKFC